MELSRLKHILLKLKRSIYAKSVYLDCQNSSDPTNLFCGSDLIKILIKSSKGSNLCS